MTSLGISAQAAQEEATTDANFIKAFRQHSNKDSYVIALGEDLEGRKNHRIPTAFPSPVLPGLTELPPLKPVFVSEFIASHSQQELLHCLESISIKMLFFLLWIPCYSYCCD